MIRFELFTVIFDWWNAFVKISFFTFHTEDGEETSLLSLEKDYDELHIDVLFFNGIVNFFEGNIE